MLRLAELIAGWPGGPIIACLFGTCFALMDIVLVVRWITRWRKRGFASAIARQADLVTGTPGYSAALYSQIAIFVASNLMLLSASLRLREALPDASGAVGMLLVPIALVGLLSGLGGLVLAVLINREVINRQA